MPSPPIDEGLTVEDIEKVRERLAGRHMVDEVCTAARSWVEQEAWKRATGQHIPEEIVAEIAGLPTPSQPSPLEERLRAHAKLHEPYSSDPVYRLCIEAADTLATREREIAEKNIRIASLEYADAEGDKVIELARQENTKLREALEKCDRISTLICTKQETPYPAEVEDIQTIARAALGKERE